jgi:hypothetical protein
MLHESYSYSRGYGYTQWIYTSSIVGEEEHVRQLRVTAAPRKFEVERLASKARND